MFSMTYQSYIQCLMQEDIAYMQFEMLPHTTYNQLNNEYDGQ